MKAILSADLNWAIGYKGQLLMRVPEDMKYFKGVTMGKVVVMGGETYKSLPNMEPLKGRINIVLSKTMKDSKDKWAREGLILCSSLDDLFLELKKYESDDIFVIGGESVYTQLLPFCDEACVTRFYREFVADRYFPNLDLLAGWELAEKGEEKYYRDLSFRFVRYINREVKAMD